jgi:phospholipid/cholesterol/gamma-HCH transport system substrate-binding protein
VLGIGIGGYILSNQRLRFPIVEEAPFTVKVDLPDAQAVQPGQGQTVRTAGVEIGQIGKVTLEGGHAVVEMQLEPKYKDYIKEDATALLRTKTGLKDMFIEVDPGTGKPLKENGHIAVASSAPDTDGDEILAALDTDTRDYLKLLISGGGKGLKGKGQELQNTFAALGPTNRDLERVTTAIARRRTNLKNLVHRYGLLTKELSTKDADIVRLVRSSNEVFGALASQSGNISEAVERLPGTLNQTNTTLGKVETLSNELGPTLEALRPAFRQLDSTNRQLLPFFKSATPAIQKQIRPFARNAQPFTRDIGFAARDLDKAAPDLTISFNKVNRLFNIGAYNPAGAGKPTGTLQQQANAPRSYLYWLAWLGQNTNSLFSTADGQGVFRRIAVGGVGCGTFGALLGELPAPLKTQLLGLLGGIGLCSP